VLLNDDIMASRSLTEVFILMRNNAMQNRHIFSEHLADDRAALVGNDEVDIELGNSVPRTSQLTPQCSDALEEVQFEISRIQKKMKELSVLHDRHLHRPTLDDSEEEERSIELLTDEITQMFHRCQRTVQRLIGCRRQGSVLEQRLNSNITSSVARSLQELSTAFRSSQSAYLKKLQGREERSKQYFHTDVHVADGSQSDELLNQEFGSSRLQMFVDDNSLMVQQREKEILQIVRSIQDLNEIFKDLATMVVDQGTILDRIDYNVEQTATHVEKGLQQLQKAEKYQKKNRKMLVISVMFIIVIVLLIILIGVKAS
jgi:syntaxin 16